MNMETIEFIKIQDMINDLYKKVESIANEKNVRPAVDSNDIKELSAALAKAQAEYDVALEDMQNSQFKKGYASYTSIVKASRPALSKYGLSVNNALIYKDDGIWLSSVLLHSSGGKITSRVLISPEKSTLQDLAKVISTMKRVSYILLTGVIAGDEDEKEQASTPYKPIVKPVIPSPAQSQQAHQNNVQEKYKKAVEEMSVSVKITPDQLEQLNAELNNYPKVRETLLKGMKEKMNIDSFHDLPKINFLSMIGRVRELKFLEDDAKKVAEQKAKEAGLK
jgi:hypothetical protein